MDDQELESLLREHLAGELDGQTGASRRAFVRRLMIRQRVRQLAASLVVAAAAAIAVLLILPSREVSPPPPHEQIVQNPLPAPVQPQAARTFVTGTFDDGIVLMADKTPARRIRQRVVERTQWFDPARQTYVEVQRPTEHVFFVTIEKY